MPDVTLNDSHLSVSLSRREKLAGLLRDLSVPLSSVVDAEALDDGLAAVRGIRAPGLAVPRVVKIGTWRGAGGKHYVAVARGGPALRLQLRDAPYRTALVSTPDAADLARRLPSA